MLNTPTNAELINKFFDVMAKEPIRIDDFLKELLPVYERHFSLREIQELNKFYSTDLMRGMVRVLPLVMQESVLIAIKLMNEYEQRLEERMRNLGE